MCRFDGVGGEYAHLAVLVANYRKRQFELRRPLEIIRLRGWKTPTITEVFQVIVKAFKKSAVAPRSSLPNVYTDVD